MNFIIQDHAIRGGHFLDLISAQIQLLRGGCTVCACGNGVNHFSLRRTERTVQSHNILGCGNRIHSPLKTADGENWLIQSLVACHGREYLARLLHGNRAFLRHIGAYHFDDRDAAFLLGVFLHHIQRNRLGV